MRIIIGITGASGAVLGIRLLEVLREVPDCETHLVMSTGGKLNIEYETDYSVEQVKELADFCYSENEIGAKIASGSFKTDGMIIAPCSMKSVGALSQGYADNLLLRAADVCLKEKRKLVIMPRETPMHAIHLKNLADIASLGAMVMLPVLTFYHKPTNINDMVNHLIGKVLMYFGIEFSGLVEWKGC